MSSGEKVLIVGCGYRGRRLAQRLQAEGCTVRGMTRSPEHAARLADLNIQPVIADVTQPETLGGIGEGVDTVYHLMGSMGGDDTALYARHVTGTKNLLYALAGVKLSRYIYESSTAVYGQTEGEWIDETAPLEPSSNMGKLRIQAEDLLLTAWRERGLPAVILRPSSIYRPEGVINEKIRNNAYVLTSDPAKLMNHIYVEDYLDLLTLARTRGIPGEAYNVSDDGPKRGVDYVNHIADLMGVSHPRVEWEAPADGCADLVRQSSKRVANDKIKRDFGIAALRFPTYKEGLAASARLGWKE
jgi:nucleoside-diphosphate-sugar epimerase